MKESCDKKPAEGFCGYEEEDAGKRIPLSAPCLDGDEDAMSIIHLTHQCVVLNGLYHDFRDSKCPQRLNDDEVIYPFKGLIHFKGHHVKGSL
jgi:hypothetical protein